MKKQPKRVIKQRNTLPKKIRQAPAAEKLHLAFAGSARDTIFEQLANTWGGVRAYAAGKTAPPIESSEDLIFETFSVYLNNGIPWKKTTETADQSKGRLFKHAHAELSRLVTMAMIRDDSEFFRNLADAMDARRRGRAAADPMRAALYCLISTKRIDSKGNPIPPLSNMEICEELQKLFPDRSVDEKQVRRMKKDLKAPDK